MATEQDNKAFARRWNEEIFEKQNLDAIDDLVAENFVGYDPGLPEPMRGPDDVRELVEMIHSAFADLTVVLDRVIAEGDRLAVHNTITGTHAGEYLGIEPTGEEFEVTITAFQRFEDGQLVEEWQLVDRLSLLQQLDVVELPMG